MKKKTVFLAVLAAVVVAAAFIIYNRPQSLVKVMGEPFGSEATRCRVVEVDRFDYEADLSLGSLLADVTVRGPYPEKDTAYGYTWIDIYAVGATQAQGEPDARWELNVIREEQEDSGSTKLLYSFNVGGRCYKVVSGEEKIDAFIDLLSQPSKENT